ncbi:UNVERIFIED_CONTAM: hypothetical protein Slati_0490500 [Sesamum latifolium]|uniref:Retrovirus-related Pol polyprotein from transposon TNT 1-94-like beta-barrel domain-containing protein n=1 Tax=Sesamum latifolium TaxID=2727402 RepID=A0AAW2XYI1_9LAMI
MDVSGFKALPDLSKLEPLDETNYKRWSQKLLIFFEQLDVDYVLFTVTPVPEAPAETSSIAITPVTTEEPRNLKTMRRKPGHKTYQCFQRKDQQKTNNKLASQPTLQVKLTKQEEAIVAVVVEANLVENKTDWILDMGASKHFSSNKDLFQELHEVPDGECIFMGNSTTAGVLGKGKIFLKLTSGKTLALNDVLYDCF